MQAAIKPYKGSIESSQQGDAADCDGTSVYFSVSNFPNFSGLPYVMTRKGHEYRVHLQLTEARPDLRQILESKSEAIPCPLVDQLDLVFGRAQAGTSLVTAIIDRIAATKHRHSGSIRKNQHGVRT